MQDRKGKIGIYIKLRRDVLAKFDAVASAKGNRSRAIEWLLSLVEVTYREETVQVPVIHMRGAL